MGVSQHAGRNETAAQRAAHGGQQRLGRLLRRARQQGRAIPGFAYLPEDDLLGLVGKHPTQKDPVRWVAGMGHELGHALGLPHPRDTKKHYDALMWAGFYGKYPDHCYLTDEDKAILARSPFIMAPAELNLVPRPHRVKLLEFHVAPTGNDRNPGTAAQPFATLERARTPSALPDWRARPGAPSGCTEAFIGASRHSRSRSRIRERASTRSSTVAWQERRRD